MGALRKEVQVAGIGRRQALAARGGARRGCEMSAVASAKPSVK